MKTITSFFAPASVPESASAMVTMPASGSAHVPSWVLECLEPRLAPAGVVAVTMNGSTLTLEGTDVQNVIQVVENGSQWVIRDHEGEGTTFSLNGAAAVAELRVAPVANIKVTLKGGDDVFQFQSLSVGGSVTVFGNEGRDLVSMDNCVVQGAVKLDLGDGANYVGLTDANFAKTLSIKSGAGDDELVFFNGSFGSVQVDTGKGSDSVEFAGDLLHVRGALTVKSAGGVGTDSTLAMYVAEGMFGGKVSYTLAEGNARVQLGLDFIDRGVQLANGMSIRTGDGDDVVALENTVLIGGLLDMNLGNGNNLVTAVDAALLNVGAVKYTGGSGNDVMLMNAENTLISGGVTGSLGAGLTNSMEFEGDYLVIGGKLTYKGGTGGDVLALKADGAQVSGAISFTGGNGSNTLDIGLGPVAVAGGVTAKGGVDGDVFRLINTEVAGKVSVNHGKGGSNVQISESGLYSSLTLVSASAVGSGESVDITDSRIYGAVALKATGDAATTYNVHHNTFGGAFSLSSGGGDDLIYLDIYGQTAVNTFNGAVKIVLGAGNDELRAGANPVTMAAGNVFGSSLSVDGGTGTDEAFFLDGYNNTFDTEPVVKGFEAVV